MKQFRMKTLLNGHLTFYQQLNLIDFRFYISKDKADEHNWLISLSILFWSVDYSWNGRRKHLKIKP